MAHIFKWIQAQQDAAAQGTSLSYYFHAGETSFAGNSTAADNLFDAVAFNATRIGHGLALTKYPSLIDEVIRRNIAIEVCPLSNQALLYVTDVRDHPAATLLARGVAITISPDDPSILGYDDVSYDWFYAFMAWNVDLKSLKQMAINSIRYSSLDQPAKSQLMNHWSKQWSLWISKASTALDH